MVQISQFCHRIDGSDITNSKFESFNIHECPEKCQKIFSMVDAAPPNGMPQCVAEDCKLQEIFHNALSA